MSFQEQYRDHFTTAVYRQESFFSSVLLVLPRENFSFPSDHTSMTYTMLLCVIMAWLYIKLTRKTTPDEPTGDPVDSDPTRYIRPCWTDGLIPTGFCFPHLKLWPFSPVLPVQVKHSRNHAYLRCGLSATYHCMPLTSFLSQSTNTTCQGHFYHFYFHRRNLF